MDNKLMQKIFFWVFFGLFVVVCILTILALFTPVIKIDPEFKKPLVYAFVMEVAILVAALFRQVFAIKKTEPETQKVQLVQVVAKQAAYVDDSPIGDIQLDKNVVPTKDSLQQTPDKFIRSFFSKEKFQEKFSLKIIMYSAVDGGGSNITVSLDPNPLVQNNITLQQHLELVFQHVDSIFKIKGDVRELRVNNSGNTAVSWYTLEIPDPANKDNIIEVMQYSKVVVVEDMLASLMISYNPATTHPGNINMMHTLLQEFGTEKIG